MALPIVHHQDYDAPLPPGHRFPMGKFKALRAVLERDGLGAGMSEPVPAKAEQLCRAHDPAYVEAVFSQTVAPAIVRRIGLPVTEAVALRAAAATGGTIRTAELALAHGIACNTAGGSHHAARDGGAGFCVFNDVATAAYAMLDQGRALRILVVDLDVHQGDGTAAIFAEEPAVFTFSMHAEKNYPSRKAVSDLDLGLPCGMGDEAYLGLLRDTLPGLLERHRPELVFYIAGVDPYEGDQLGRLKLSREGLFARDLYVLETARGFGAAVAGVLGGGYGQDVGAIADLHAQLHRAAAQVWARG
jgi:acetoin utilization deacetylase AcuC-like enzyme